jgi:hypothetical protein
MPPRLAAVLRRYASRSIQLEREVLKNPDFRSLCEDYGEAVEALERWSRGNDPLSPQRVLEYQRLVRDLEQEIEIHLGKKPAC